jgi:hypothetical protein
VSKARSTAKERAAQIDVHHLIECLSTRLSQIGCLSDTGIIDENIDSAVAGHRISHQSLDLPFISDIGLNRQRLPTLRPDL